MEFMLNSVPAGDGGTADRGGGMVRLTGLGPRLRCIPLWAAAPAAAPATNPAAAAAAAGLPTAGLTGRELGSSAWGPKGLAGLLLFPVTGRSHWLAPPGDRGAWLLLLKAAAAPAATPAAPAAPMGFSCMGCWALLAGTAAAATTGAAWAPA